MGTPLRIFAVTLILVIKFSDAREYKPETSQDFQTALNKANPGDTIQLMPTDYYGDFVMQRSGDKYHKIKIFGSQNEDGSSATGVIGNTTTLFIKADYIFIKDMNISGVEEGLYLEGHNNSAESLGFYGLKQAVLIEGTRNVLGSISINDVEDGIFVRGSDNTFRDMTFSQVTSGLIVESGNRTKLHNIAIHNSLGKLLALVLSEGTCCGRVSNTIYDGLVEIKGDNYNFRSTVADAINIEGCNNSFGRSVFGRSYFTKLCKNNMVTSNISHFPQSKPTKLEDV